MTYSTFEGRLNYYFNSTDEDSLSVLAEIFDGVVCPTMATEEKKELYKDLNPQYSEIYTSYTLMKMLKNYSPDAFVEQSREIPEEDKIIHDFVCMIFFEDRIFGE